MIDWKKVAKENGIHRRTYSMRVDSYGWDPERAATTPPRRRRDRKWTKVAKRNGIEYNTYRHRVDNMLWTPEEAATTPAMSKSEVMENARKIGAELREIQWKRSFNDEDNLYNITPHHIEIAEESGIERSTVETRIYQQGWTIQEAITTPMQNHQTEKPEGFYKYREIAEGKGIAKSTYDARIKRGWSVENAASTDPHYKHRRTDTKWMELAAENGIDYSAYINRVTRQSWTPEEAATTPMLARGEYLNEETKEKARQGLKDFNTT